MNKFQRWLNDGINRVYIFIASGCLLILFAGLLFIFLYFLKKPEGENLIDSTDFYQKTAISSSTEEQLAKKEDQLGFIDLKGAVKKPGMYEYKEGMRVLDLVEQAGGFLENADTRKVNFSLRVEDQMVIYIPKEGEELDETIQEYVEKEEIQGKKEQEKGEGDKININTADATQLQTLNGVGLKKAEEIIRHREANGSFQSVEELKTVSGIGEKIFESLKDSITIK